jgi:hypothetical protein
VTTKNLEERVKALEEANDRLQHDVERIRAVNEILNLVHRLQWFHSNNRGSETAQLFATQPDSRVYFGTQGYWQGSDAAQKATQANMELMGTKVSKVGMIAFHLMANPIIEVAGDGKTAKGVWVASGMIAMKDHMTGKPIASWEWNRYGIDFIKEDGKWKLWHHHVFDLFRVGWDDKWEQQFSSKEVLNMKTDFPPTPLDDAYSPDTELPYIPPPEPYETFDPNLVY